jgi:hypothetical protein
MADATKAAITKPTQGGPRSCLTEEVRLCERRTSPT